jgi:hypothetical protein
VGQIKKYARDLSAKLEVFRRATETRKSLFLTFITTYGVMGNDYRTSLVQSSVTADALFDD